MQVAWKNITLVSWSRQTLSLSLLAAMSFTICADDESARHAATHFLEQNRIHQGAISRSQDYDQLHARVSATRDPETKLHPFIFALAGRHKKLLAATQQVNVATILSRRHNDSVNWHDVRNVVRVHAQMKMWQYAAESDPAIAARLKTDWDEWSDLRLAYMFQEHVAKERFQRAMWDVYTPHQRQQIITGELPATIKKNVGHKRLFSANKQVQRALGMASHQERFDKATANWIKKWDQMLARYQAAAQFERKREFAMEFTDEEFAVAAWSDYEVAFRAFSGHECAAIRELVQVGYQPGPELESSVAAFVKKLRFQMIEKFGKNATLFSGSTN